MKANEVRIGNLLRNSKNNLVIVDKKTIEILCDNRLAQYPVGITPGVPLTEKILLGLGFERHFNDYYNDVILIKDLPDFETGLEVSSHEILLYHAGLNPAVPIAKCKKITYIHELQNLYYAITGEELVYTKSE